MDFACGKGGGGENNFPSSPLGRLMTWKLPNYIKDSSPFQFIWKKGLCIKQANQNLIFCFKIGYVLCIFVGKGKGREGKEEPNHMRNQTKPNKNRT